MKGLSPKLGITNYDSSVIDTIRILCTVTRFREPQLHNACANANAYYYFGKHSMTFGQIHVKYNLIDFLTMSKK